MKPEIKEESYGNKFVNSMARHKAEKFLKKYESQLNKVDYCIMAQRYEDKSKKYNSKMYSDYCDLNEETQSIIIERSNTSLNDFQGSEDNEELIEIKWADYLLRNIYCELPEASLSVVSDMCSEILHLKEMEIVRLGEPLLKEIDKFINQYANKEASIDNIKTMMNIIIPWYQDESVDDIKKTIYVSALIAVMVCYWVKRWPYHIHKEDVKWQGSMQELKYQCKVNVDNTEDMALEILVMLRKKMTETSFMPYKELQTICDFEEIYKNQKIFYPLAVYAYVYGRANIDFPGKRYVFNRDIYENIFKQDWQGENSTDESESALKLRVNKTYTLAMLNIMRKYGKECPIHEEDLFSPNYYKIFPVYKFYEICSEYMPIIVSDMHDEHQKMINDYVEKCLNGQSLEEIMIKNPSEEKIKELFPPHIYIETAFENDFEANKDYIKSSCIDFQKKNGLVFGFKKEFYLTYITQALKKYGYDPIEISESDEKEISKRIRDYFDNINDQEMTERYQELIKRDCDMYDTQRQYERMLLYTMYFCEEYIKKTNPDRYMPVHEDLICKTYETVEDMVLCCIQAVCMLIP